MRIVCRQNRIKTLLVGTLLLAVTVLGQSGGATVEGTALDENGAGIDGWVILFGRTIVQGYMYPYRQADARTSANGSFRASGLPSGHYYAAFVPATLNPDSRRRAFPVTVYPASPDLKGAQILDLVAGGVQQLQFRLKSSPAYNVTGTFDVVGENLNLTLQPVTSTGLAAGNNVGLWRTEHSFRFWGVLPGDYVIQITRSGEPVAVEYVTVGSEDLTGVQLVKPPPGPLRGSFKVLPRDPAAAVPPYSGSRNIELRLGNSPSMVESYSGDSFLKQHPRPGNSRVVVRAPNPEYVRSIRQGSRDVVREGLSIAPVGTPDPIEIEIGFGQARVTAVVTAPGLDLSGKPPVPVAVVFLRNDGEHLVPQLLTSTLIPHGLPSPTLGPNQNVIVSPDMAPGEYTIFAWQTSLGKLRQLAFSTDEFQTKFASSIVRVTLGESGSTAIEIPQLLPPEAFATGELLFPEVML
ncbi:MAG: hypothetical protein ABI824_13715 [Acidobacteriota bacterium]